MLERSSDVRFRAVRLGGFVTPSSSSPRRIGCPYGHWRPLSTWLGAGTVEADGIRLSGIAGKDPKLSPGARHLKLERIAYFGPGATRAG